MAVSYPPVGFHFSVQIEGIGADFSGKEDIGFQEISGVSADIGVEEYREGGENRFAHRMPNPVSYPNLVLKRGMLVGSQAVNWFKNEVQAFNFKTYNMTVNLLNQDHEVLQGWNFVQAWPLKWSVEGFNAQDNSIMMESMEFVYQYYTMIKDA
ncbi:MAG: phage tail protein [Bacteroidota bacterium]